MTVKIDTANKLLKDLWDDMKEQMQGGQLPIYQTDFKLMTRLEKFHEKIKY